MFARVSIHLLELFYVPLLPYGKISVNLNNIKSIGKRKVNELYRNTL